MARAEALTNILGGGNEIIYALRLKLFAKWGMGGEAEQLLRQMEEEHSKGQLKNGPSVIHYTCALNAWAKSTDENASEKAKALFLTMESNPEIQLGELCVDVLVFITTIHYMGVLREKQQKRDEAQMLI